MNAPEFLVEFTKAYGNLLAHLWWPLVVLVIFFSILYYFDRSIGSLGRRKRFPMTWKNMTQIVSQLERRYLTEMSPDKKSSQRQKIAHELIQKAKRGIEQRDEQEIVKVLVSLSSLGLYTDRQLPPHLSPEEVAWLESDKNNEEINKPLNNE